MPFTINRRVMSVGASIGISRASDSTKSRAQVLSEADKTLYTVKEAGGGNIRVFNRDMAAHARDKEELASDLASAIFSNEIQAYYQPIYNVRDRRVGGFECLARWQHPEHGLIAPDRFIPIAEATGLIGKLGESILRQACAMLTTLPPDLYVAINVSPRQFEEEDTVDMIRHVVASSGLDPRRLVIEITENVLLTDTQRNLDLLRQLKGLGIRLSIDDFGTGYSSFSYIEAFMPDKIKIERGFVARLHSRAVPR